MLRWIGIISLLLLLSLIASDDAIDDTDYNILPCKENSVCIVFMKDDECLVNNEWKKGMIAAIWEKGACKGGKYQNLIAMLEIEPLSAETWKCVFTQSTDSEFYNIESVQYGIVLILPGVLKETHLSEFQTFKWPRFEFGNSNISFYGPNTVRLDWINSKNRQRATLEPMFTKFVVRLDPDHYFKSFAFNASAEGLNLHNLLTLPIDYFNKNVKKDEEIRMTMNETRFLQLIKEKSENFSGKMTPVQKGLAITGGFLIIIALIITVLLIWRCKRQSKIFESRKGTTTRSESKTDKSSKKTGKSNRPVSPDIEGQKKNKLRKAKSIHIEDRFHINKAPYLVSAETYGKMPPKGGQSPR